MGSACQPRDQKSNKRRTIPMNNTEPETINVDMEFDQPDISVPRNPAPKRDVSRMTLQTPEHKATLLKQAIANTESNIKKLKVQLTEQKSKLKKVNKIIEQYNNL